MCILLHLKKMTDPRHSHYSLSASSILEKVPDVVEPVKLTAASELRSLIGYDMMTAKSRPCFIPVSSHQQVDRPPPSFEETFREALLYFQARPHSSAYKAT